MTTATPAPHVSSNYSARNNATAPSFADVAVDQIHPSPLNPRRQFDEQALVELAESIKTDGLLEPVVVRPGATMKDGYSLIAGERRWRAAQLAGLKTIAARILTDVDDKTALRLALLENLQRQDLDPIEEAEGYRALAHELGLKQTEIAAAVKRSQPAVAKSMSLLDLPDDVVTAIRDGRLSVAHGVALAKYKKFPVACSAIAAAAIEGSWNTRQLEHGVPGAYDLERKGVLKVLSTWNAPFDVAATCQHCPYGAYRPSVNSGDICLRPEHYDELVAAHKAEKQATLASQTAAAKEAGTTVFKLSDMDRHTYRGMWKGKEPSGCSEACTCRAQAESWGGGELVPICTDPKRFDKLQRADEARKKQEAAAAYATHLGELEARLRELEALWSVWPPPGAERASASLEGRAVALVVQMALSRLDEPDLTEVLRARASGLEERGLTGYRFNAAVGERLAALPVREQLALALDALLRSELRQHRDWPTQPAERFAWFMAETGQGAAGRE